MRMAREQIDDSLLDQVQLAIIESAMSTESAARSNTPDESAHIDKRKNLETIEKLLSGHQTSPDMKRSIASMLDQVRR
jgi:hypothetical protein